MCAHEFAHLHAPDARLVGAAFSTLVRVHGLGHGRRRGGRPRGRRRVPARALATCSSSASPSSWCRAWSILLLSRPLLRLRADTDDVADCVAVHLSRHPAALAELLGRLARATIGEWCARRAGRSTCGSRPPPTARRRATTTATSTTRSRPPCEQRCNAADAPRAHPPPGQRPGHRRRACWSLSTIVADSTRLGVRVRGGGRGRRARPGDGQRRRRPHRHVAQPVGRRRPRAPPTGAIVRRRHRAAGRAATPRSSPSTPPGPPAPTRRGHRRRHPRAVQPPRPHRARAPTPSSTPASPASSSASTTPTRSRRARASPACGAAGIEVEVARRPPPSLRQLAPYLHHRRTGRPYVVLKLAATLDGRTAAPDGTTQWITGPRPGPTPTGCGPSPTPSSSGAGTVRADDPELTVRDAEGRRPAPGRARHRAAGRPRCTRASSCDGDLGEVLDTLGGKGVLQLLVEGGPTVAGAFHRAGLVDRYVSTSRRRSSAATTRRPLFAGAGAADHRRRVAGPDRSPSTQLGADLCGIELVAGSARGHRDVHRHRRGARHRRRPRRRPRFRIGCRTVLDDVDSGRLDRRQRRAASPSSSWDVGRRGRGGRPTSSTRRSPARTSAPSSPATRSTSSGPSGSPTASAATSCRATSTASAPSCSRRPTSASRCPTASAATSSRRARSPSTA